METDLRDRIQGTIDSSKIVLFMKGTRRAPQCGFSATVVQILDQYVPEYTTVDVLADPTIRDGVKEYATWPTIPQLYVAGEFIGGALAANIHGRGLTRPPFVADVESFTLVAPDGSVVACSRTHNPELFALAIGGYGLFGVVATARLRLTPRIKIERVVEVTDIDTLPARVADRVADGYLYGDGQFDINPEADGFLRRCVFSTYRPATPEAELPADQKSLAPEDWQRLLLMTHHDKAAVFDVYADYYLSTSGQVYWSDTHQLSTYIDDYHPTIGAGTEMISEVYAPRARLGELMDRLRDDFRRHAVDVIYGTVRSIERDDETFLPWARESFACVVLNFHVDPGAAGVAKARADFQRLIDHALAVDGSYFLTYHRWARRDQVERAYPQFERFLQEKRAWDPDERFQSDWYRYYRDTIR